MSNAVATAARGGDIMESVLIKGDLSKLTPDERSRYYLKVCESVGLNPLTKPFEYITLNGKLTLYALRTCTDQLRTLHQVSVEELTETERDGVFIVTAKVRNGEGRTDMAKGAVTIASLKGDALANAMMKAETKAKRRATLSLCGLGFLDETEIETIPAESRRPARPAPSAIAPKASAPDESRPHAIDVPMVVDPETGEERHAWRAFGEALVSAIRCDAHNGVDWLAENESNIAAMLKDAPTMHTLMMKAVNAEMDKAGKVAA